MAPLTRPELWRLLGASPPGRPGVRVLSEGETEGVRWRRLELVGERRVPAFDLAPVPGAPVRSPVLYAHAHGDRPGIGKAEALEGRPALLDPPLGLALARAGHRVLCPDMAGFGERQGEGPEGALAKALLWQGRTLLGVMVEDLSGALDLLCEAEEAPAVVGFSMGAFLAAMVGALRPEASKVAHLCGMAAIAPLIASGAHDLHGPYLTIPGLLPEHDLPEVAALIAPRSQFVAAGLADPLTPPEAFGPLEKRLREVYGDGPLVVHVGAEGHVETRAMRAALLAFLA
ncbi:alpha/beta fold hydrolase [Histidinibacterium lentulum]|uniref:AB hydrolase-1 domain-containing protein n=1 Tax=Histidinibacterium lentulum TaxID=2480588 RepID=A0A3N2R852_9RHOB|nr:alpha/beta fold hydrolase [Histidinibacterium lentulum]ROU03672.1 hypothetical protein EAT49_05080 [Histidinibacterium lentulum]